MNNMLTALNVLKSKIPEPMKTILFCRNSTDLEEGIDILFQAGYAHMGNENVQINRKNNFNRRETEIISQTEITFPIFQIETISPIIKTEVCLHLWILI